MYFVNLTKRPSSVRHKHAPGTDIPTMSKARDDLVNVCTLYIRADANSHEKSLKTECIQLATAIAKKCFDDNSEEEEEEEEEEIPNKQFRNCIVVWQFRPTSSKNLA